MKDMDRHIREEVLRRFEGDFGLKRRAGTDYMQHLEESERQEDQLLNDRQRRDKALRQCGAVVEIANCYQRRRWPMSTEPRIRPTMASHRLDLPSLCDICGKARSTRKHESCSRIRQQIKQNEWASYMANVSAKKAQGGRRYAR